VHWQILALGLTFMGLGIMSDGIVCACRRAAGDFSAQPALLRFHRWFAGTSFIGLGVTARWRPRK